MAFAEALITGKTVMEIDPKGSAAKQIEALANEIRKVSRHEQKDTRTHKAAIQ
ncbi:MAG: hypothetical protein JO033_20015 [Acidobacteriaceae bacterium]|nr:hypothetical protein [Acidobacteriaceae bacterium]